MENSNLPQNRTINEAYDLIKAKDPETALTKTALRRLIVTGAIPSVKIGIKYLVDVENVWRFLRGELKQIQREPEPPQYGTIRRVV